jgi:3-oxoacyl-[acyl-carrier protein] reductase
MGKSSRQPARLQPLSTRRFALPERARILVTGGAGGIGRSLVDALLAGGARVAVLDLPRVLERYPVSPGVLAFGCDLTVPEQVTRAVAGAGEAFGALDGLVALAGFARARAGVGETTPESWSAVLSGNLDTSFLVIREALPLLRAGRDPAIVTMASGLALKATPGYGAYGVAKAGVLALTRLLAAEEAPAIRVNAVAPAAVDTAFLRGGTGHVAPDQAMRLDLERYLPTVPLGRLAEPDDVVGPILFLLSPAAAYITGQTLHINGGSLMP